MMTPLVKQPFFLVLLLALALAAVSTSSAAGGTGSRALKLLAVSLDDASGDGAVQDASGDGNLPQEKCQWYAWTQQCSTFFLSANMPPELGAVERSSSLGDFQRLMTERGDAGFHMHSVGYGDGEWLAYFRQQPRSYSWVVRSTMESFTAALDEHAKQGYRCTAMEVGGGAYLAWFQKMLSFEMSQMADKGFKQHRWQMAEGYDGMSSMVTSVRNRNREVITAMVTDGPKYVAWVEPSTNYAAEEPGAYLVAAGNTYTFNAFIHGVLKNNKNLFLTSYLFGEGDDGAPTMVGILQKDWPHVWNDLDGSEFSNSESTWATRETAASMASWIQERIVDEEGKQWCVTALDYGCLPAF